MKQLAKLLVAVALVAGLNHAFAADGRKEAVLDMGKGAFKLTVSVPSAAEGPYDFGKNPGIGGNMTGSFQHKEVMFGKNITNTSASVFYKATAQKIESSKNGKKLTADHMAQDQIKANGFEGRATPFNCPPVPFDGATSVCYKMSGDAIFDGKARPEKYAAVIISVSWASDTQGYTLMSEVKELNAEKFNADKSFYEKNAKSSAALLWNNHNLTNN